MKKISQFLLKQSGWKVLSTVVEPQKSIIAVAPHTSNWDFILGKLAYWSLGRDAGFLMKKSWFVFPLGYIFRAMGGVPINRDKNESTVQKMVNEFGKRDRFHLAITPEGTRKLVKDWKRGFYYIAVGAKVPIQLAYIDYEKKEVGIKEIFYPTGNENEDIKHIAKYYKNVTPKFPERFRLPVVE